MGRNMTENLYTVEEAFEVVQKGWEINIAHEVSGADVLADFKLDGGLDTYLPRILKPQIYHELITNFEHASGYDLLLRALLLKENADLLENAQNYRS